MKERYAKDLIVEANTLKTLVQQQILPSAYEYRKELALSANALDALSIDATAEKKLLTLMSSIVKELQENTETLVSSVDSVEQQDHLEQARGACQQILPSMDKVRTLADRLEEVVADKFWGLPKNTELLFY
ncbi:hypothetical protein K7432_012101 [Basidiobolus ranarum]|uniref:Glutamine synthetase C-terminal domain-containing protein n=1 Tax=Basidiobolus ranarum TaxID=34480 RepID=A0ABR2WLE2_9FUNG